MPNWLCRGGYPSVDGSEMWRENPRPWMHKTYSKYWDFNYQPQLDSTVSCHFSKGRLLKSSRCGVGCWPIPMLLHPACNEKPTFGDIFIFFPMPWCQPSRINRHETEEAYHEERCYGNFFTFLSASFPPWFRKCHRRLETCPTMTRTRFCGIYWQPCWRGYLRLSSNVRTSGSHIGWCISCAFDFWIPITLIHQFMVDAEYPTQIQELTLHS